MCRLIIKQHLKNDLYKRFDKKRRFFFNEFNYLETIRDINRQYDEIVLTNYDLVERLNECEYSFNTQYDLIENVNKINRKENSSRSCKSRFDLLLKLFYYSIENILTIGKKQINFK
ncbi:unnamed protein product [Rotaria sp. Silwood1]|nr:unnamed protein product [Rotaria sp. Silwood1]CAF1680537.1 unnamed protein product [Rotaria sp. Silwood1]